jgi:2,4-dienoyl-CoA reductase (NADPH2)
MKQVKMRGGVSYDAVLPQGLQVTSAEGTEVLDVDTVVL